MAGRQGTELPNVSLFTLLFYVLQLANTRGDTQNQFMKQRDRRCTAGTPGQQLPDITQIERTAIPGQHHPA